MRNDEGVIVDAKEEAIITWDRKDALARYIIYHTNDDLRQSTLLTCQSANDMWTRLTTQYMQRAAENKIQLQRDFYTFT